jgi:hypothetical protein
MGPHCQIDPIYENLYLTLESYIEVGGEASFALFLISPMILYFERKL